MHSQTKKLTQREKSKTTDVTLAREGVEKRALKIKSKNQPSKKNIKKKKEKGKLVHTDKKNIQDSPKKDVVCKKCKMVKGTEDTKCKAEVKIQKAKFNPGGLKEILKRRATDKHQERPKRFVTSLRNPPSVLPFDHYETVTAEIREIKKRLANWKTTISKPVCATSIGRPDELTRKISSNVISDRGSVTKKVSPERFMETVNRTSNMKASLTTELPKKKLLNIDLDDFGKKEDEIESNDEGDINNYDAEKLEEEGKENDTIRSTGTENERINVKSCKPLEFSMRELLKKHHIDNHDEIGNKHDAMESKDEDEIGNIEKHVGTVNLYEAMESNDEDEMNNIEKHVGNANVHDAIESTDEEEINNIGKHKINNCNTHDGMYTEAVLRSCLRQNDTVFESQNDTDNELSLVTTNKAIVRWQNSTVVPILSNHSLPESDSQSHELFEEPRDFYEHIRENTREWVSSVDSNEVRIWEIHSSEDLHSSDTEHDVSTNLPHDKEKIDTANLVRQNFGEQFLDAMNLEGLDYEEMYAYITDFTRSQEGPFKVEFPPICTHIMGDYYYDPGSPSWLDILEKYLVDRVLGFFENK